MDMGVSEGEEVPTNDEQGVQEVQDSVHGMCGWVGYNAYKAARGAGDGAVLVVAAR